MAKHGCPSGLSDDAVGAVLRYMAVALIADSQDELADRLFDAQKHFRFPQAIERRPW
jgi:hypothetical protein